MQDSSSTTSKMNGHRTEIGQFIALTLENINREYPNYLSRKFTSVHEQIEKPSDYHPAFFGCYDWHSAVHSHWQLLRAARMLPDQPFVAEVAEQLDTHLTPEKIKREVDFFQRPDFANYEIPYGLAWLLQLTAELREWQQPSDQIWLTALQPLEELSVERIKIWLTHLEEPVRSGTHYQTAFSLGLIWDWATAVNDDQMRDLIQTTAHRFYTADVKASIADEPAPADFLSPTLCEADLMRRVLTADHFPNWLSEFLPGLNASTSTDWLTPVAVVDPNDGKLAHFGGLNFSRAWMLEAIAAALSPDDPRVQVCQATAAAHLEIGLPYATHTAYMTSHWVPSFALYYLTERWR